MYYINMVYETPECKKNTVNNILHAILFGIATTSTLIAFSFSDSKPKRVLKVDSQIFKNKKPSQHRKSFIGRHHTILSIKK